MFLIREFNCCDFIRVVFIPSRIGDTVWSDVNYVIRKIEKKVVGKNLKPKLFNCKLKDDFKVPKFQDFQFEEFDEGDKHCAPRPAE